MLQKVALKRGQRGERSGERLGGQRSLRPSSTARAEAAVVTIR